MELNDEIIDKLCFSEKGKFKHKSFVNNLSLISDYLSKRYTDSKSYKETVYRIHFGLETRPVCKYCGGDVEFCTSLGKSGQYGCFKNCCSKECENKYRHNNKVNGLLKKYEVDNAGRLNWVKEKIKETTYSHYGTYCGFSSPEIRNKCKETCLSLYGVDNASKSQIVINKIAQTKLIRYGDPNYCNVEKIKETTYSRFGTYWALQNQTIKQKANNVCLEKYGYIYPIKSNDVKNRMEINNYIKYGVTHTQTLPEIIEKTKQTCIERYGVTSYLATPQMIKKSHSPEVIEKQRQTKIKNGTLGGKKSILEDIVYNLICEKFNNVIRHYKTNEYPFDCDFYIPELNLYIEFQGHQSHGPHPYNENSEEDKIIINELIHKFGNANTFTIRDPYKRKIAKENKLNYLELFGIKQVKEWLKTYDR